MTISTLNCRTDEILIPVDKVLREEVEHFLYASPNFHYRQTFDWINAQGKDSFRIFVTYDDRRIGAVSFVETRRSRLPGLASAHVVRGPICHRTEYLDRHTEALIQKLGKRFTSLRINPFLRASDKLLRLGEEWALCDKPQCYSDTLIAPVLAAEDEQWRTLRRSTRTSINRSKENGVLIIEGGSGRDYRAFAESFSSFATTKRIAPLSEDLAESIHEEFNANPPSGAFLLSAVKGQHTLGQSLLMRNAKSLIYEWGWTALPTNRRNVPIMHRLIWEALNVCRREGCSELDLGGYWADRGNADPINHFKLGFTKKVRVYVPEYEVTLSATKSFLKRAIRWTGRSLTGPYSL